MTMRRIVHKWALLVNTNIHNRQFVRYRKHVVTSEVKEKYLQCEMNPNSSSKITLISHEESDHIYITKYSYVGFSLQNDVRLSGPTVFFPRNVLKWKIFRAADINEKSLSLFGLITPKLDLLIIGTGRKKQELHPDTIRYLRQNHINFEVLTSEHAIAAFNFENSDQRWVAAAIIPPERVGSDVFNYVQGVYKEILDSTDMVYKDEKKLPVIEATEQKKLKTRLEMNSNNWKQMNGLEKVQRDVALNNSYDAFDLEITPLKSPLGQSLDFLSRDSIPKDDTLKVSKVSTRNVWKDKNDSFETKNRTKSTKSEAKSIEGETKT